MGDEHVRHSDRRAGLVRVGDTVLPKGVSLDQACGAPDDPVLTARFEVRGGRPECVHLSITSHPDGRGIRLRDLDVFTLDAFTESAFARFALPAPAAGPAVTDDDIKRFLSRQGTPTEREQWAARRDVHEARAGRRRDEDRDELERVAEVYRDNVDRQPTKAVALVLGYSTRTAARRVQQARAAGLLPSTTPGKRKA